MGRNILCVSTILAISWTLASSQGCTKEKVKFGQLSGFTYTEACGGAPGDEFALLGSGVPLDCGVNGTDIVGPITFDYPLPGGETRNLCLSVFGVDFVEIILRLGGLDVDLFTEDLSGSTGWTQVCTLGINTAANSWSINLTPKVDGSSVLVKNAKLAACV